MNRRKFFRSAAALVGAGVAAPFLSKLPVKKPELTQEMLNEYAAAMDDWCELIIPTNSAILLTHRDLYGKWEFVTGSDSVLTQNKILS